MGEHASHIEKLLNLILAPGGTFFAVIDVPHEMIHLGRSFSRSVTLTKDNGENADVLLVVPNTFIEPHFTLSYSSSESGVIHLYEGTDGSGGSSVPLYNNNRRSSNVCGTIVTSTPSIITPGTELNAKQVGSGGIGQTSFGGAGISRHERILNQDIKYLVRFSSTAAANLIILTVNIYELGH